MIYPLDKYVDIIIKLNISPMQVFFLQLIYEKRYDLLYKIGNEGHFFPVADLQDLEDKDLVINTNPNTTSQYADFYEVTPKFADSFYTASINDAEEFWKSYPPFITINGKKVPAKAVNKEELLKWYHKHIGAVHCHAHVMDALDFAVQKKLISVRIDKWLQSEAFADIWQIMENMPPGDLPHDKIL
jgi:hypothetical protein